jgi:hypothetical protein
MSSSRGANKAQAVGKLSGGKDARKGSGQDKEQQNMHRQIAQYLELVARFRAKLAPPEENDEEETP